MLRGALRGVSRSYGVSCGGHRGWRGYGTTATPVPMRFVTATSLFDGHDASINIMRRLLQECGAEVVHLAHNRSVDEVIRAALQARLPPPPIPSSPALPSFRSPPDALLSVRPVLLQASAVAQA